MSNERRAMLIRPFCLFVAFFPPCAETREFGPFQYGYLETGEKKQQGFCKKNNTVQQYGDSNKKKKQHICAVDGVCVSVCVGIRRCCEGSGGA